MELLDLVRVFFALVAVIGMIGLAAIIAKKLGFQNGAAAFRRTRRLAVVETLAIDQRRRAAIISCDGREHLIIIDQSRVSVIERGLPARESAEETDPIAAHANALTQRSLNVPEAVVRFMQRAPRDHTTALRAAGVL